MLYLIIIFLTAFLLGINFLWVDKEYDELRIIEIILILITGLFYFFRQKEKNYISNQDSIFLLSLGFLALGGIYYHGTIFQVYDFIQIIGMFLLFCCLKQVDLLSSKNLKLYCALVIMVFLPTINIILSVVELLRSGHWYRWQLNYGSPRVIDSVLVVIFWLGIYLINYNLFLRKIFPLLCFFIFLGLFFDGARAALVSIIVPLVILSYTNKEYRRTIIIIFSVGIISYVVFWTTQTIFKHLYPSKEILNISRYSSSGRSEMWLFAFEQWLKNPIVGLGGGYLAGIQYNIGHHMHNVYLRFIFEWGAVGILFLCWLLIKFVKLFSSNTHIILKMGTLAILIDGFFSGNFIYPAAQVICVLFFALAFQQMRVQKYRIHKSFISEKYIFCIFYGVFLFLIVKYLAVDMQCVDCAGIEGVARPYFWQHGGSTKLERVE